MGPHECPATKRCSKCLQEKPLTDFYRSKGRPFSQCKVCYLQVTKAWAKANPDRRKAAAAKRRDEKRGDIKRYMADYYVRNRERVLKNTRAYQSRPEVRERNSERLRQQWQANREAIMASRKARLESDPQAKARWLEYLRSHYRQNKSHYLAKWAKRRAAKLQATPTWANQVAIDALYERARRLTLLTGIVHEVDHIMPLVGKRVCGLHVEDNLRVTTRLVNRSKSNRLVEDIV